MIGGRPIKSGEHASQRPGETGNAVGDNRQPIAREPRRIPVGVERQRVHLWLHPLDDAPEDGAAADLKQALVAAAHALGATTGKDDAHDRADFAPRHAPALPRRLSRNRSHDANALNPYVF